MVPATDERQAPKYVYTSCGLMMPGSVLFARLHTSLSCLSGTPLAPRTRGESIAEEKLVCFFVCRHFLTPGWVMLFGSKFKEAEAP